MVVPRLNVKSTLRINYADSGLAGKIVYKKNRKSSLRLFGTIALGGISSQLMGDEKDLYISFDGEVGYTNIFSDSTVQSIFSDIETKIRSLEEFELGDLAKECVIEIYPFSPGTPHIDITQVSNSAFQHAVRGDPEREAKVRSKYPFTKAENRRHIAYMVAANLQILADQWDIAAAELYDNFFVGMPGIIASFLPPAIFEPEVKEAVRNQIICSMTLGRITRK